ncbi:hypothetical protein [Methylomonas albis]|uniref:Uncharacterized protein n=1 Tax=Methylomonas albis TaxID=1854563 RepID=A0ABR9D000_9GAMM|nr:hypothetical protein [Methylomonas albis]MBD9356126.1 hypothetical protein [Methylomonas albis]
MSGIYDNSNETAAAPKGVCVITCQIVAYFLQYLPLELRVAQHHIGSEPFSFYMQQRGEST